MKLYKFCLLGRSPFVLCKQSVGRSYVWRSEDRAADSAIDLPEGDALILAKLLKLVVCEFQPHGTHVVNVLDGAQLDQVKTGFGIVPCLVVIDLADTFNDVTAALGGVKDFSLNGLAHLESLGEIAHGSQNLRNDVWRQLRYEEKYAAKGQAA